MTTLDQIKNLIGSDGKKGWPVATRDRIAFPYKSELRVTDANVGVAFLWVERSVVIPKLQKENLAIAANFYMPSGIVAMIRNILANPYIRYVIMFGDESLQRIGDTSADAIRTFFKKGFDQNRKLKGFESLFCLDKNIPLDCVDDILQNVHFIDLNTMMPNASLDEKIIETNRLISILDKKPPFAEPKVFEYESTSTSFPYEEGPITVHGNTIPEAWIKMISQISRYGQNNLMNAGTDRKVKEINNMTVVVHNPQDMNLSLNPFLTPLSVEGIKAYQAEILSSVLPQGKAYTYGNKLRAYGYPDGNGVKKLVSQKDYVDFEFGQGGWLDENVLYKDNVCEIDQIRDLIEVLKRDKYSKACIAITWHPADELMRKHKSSPCLVLIQAIVCNEKLNLTVFFRSHDMVQGWPENAYGMAAIQAEIANAIGLPCGLLVIISGSAQIYNNYYKPIEEMVAKYKKYLISCSDRRGNFVIEVQEMNGKKFIKVALLHPDTGQELETYVGKTAYIVLDKIASKNSLTTAHALYLGTELAIAELKIKSGEPYEQDKTFETSRFKI